MNVITPSQIETQPAPSFASSSSDGLRGRLQREFRTVEAMVQCYCRDHHGQAGVLCGECQGLLDYAAVRLARCRFGQAKPTCANCPVHCYHPSRRQQVKDVMRYAGPRMLWQHPVLAFLHVLDGQRPAAK